MIISSTSVLWSAPGSSVAGAGVLATENVTEYERRRENSLLFTKSSASYRESAPDSLLLRHHPDLNYFPFSHSSSLRLLFRQESICLSQITLDVVPDEQERENGKKERARRRGKEKKVPGSCSGARQVRVHKLCAEERLQLDAAVRPETTAGRSAGPTMRAIKSLGSSGPKVFQQHSQEVLFISLQQFFLPAFSLGRAFALLNAMSSI